MFERLGNPVEYLKRNRLPLTAVVIALLGFYLWQVSFSNSEKAVATQSTPMIGNDFELDTVQDELGLSTPTFATKTPSGKYHPTTGIFYESISPPTGYEGFTCYRIPNDGTSFGSVLLGGDDNTTISDVREAVIFINGNPVSIDLSIPPIDWDEAELVRAGDIGCTLPK